MHGSKFSPAKYELVHFTRDPEANVAHPLRLPHATIEASESCKYLGIHLDTKLQWNHHCEEMMKKTTRTLSGLSALASSTWGTSLINLRRAYKAVVVPQVMYGCSVWHTPGRAGPMSALINRTQT